MGFWIAAIIALLLAGLGLPAVQPLHGMALPTPETMALLAAAFALTALLTRRRTGRVSD